MKNRVFFLILLTAFSLVLHCPLKSQTMDVIVGTGTSTTHISPFNNFYKNSWTECIYLASEIGESGYINRVAWECSDSYSFSMNTVAIYMGTTTRQLHSSSGDWQNLGDLELVYSGQGVQVPNSTGWHFFDLDNAFEYSGTENLVVVVAKTAPNYTSSLKYFYTSRSSAVLYRRSDSYTTYADHPGSNTGTLSDNIANIRLFFTNVNCPSPQNITVTNIAADSATVSWVGNGSATQWEVGYGLTEAEAQANTTIVTGTSIVLSDLDAETQYVVVVRSLCDTISSLWRQKSFKTACAGNFEYSECFDLTNLYASNILCTYGNFSNPYSNNGVMTNRHTVVTTPSYDVNTGYMLPTIPDCRDYSIRLGNENTGAEAESISVNYLVDTTNADLLLLQYAVVMEDPGHSPEDQPRFTLEILNNNNQVIDGTCGYENFIASSGLGWSSYGGVIWNEWTTVGMDLTAYHGQNVKIRLTTRDCEQHGHFGYAYFTLECGNKRMKSNFCGTDSIKTFLAPAGFRYQWYWESRPDSIVSTGRTCSVSSLSDDRIVCKVISLKRDSCYFHIYGSMAPRYPYADFSSSMNYCTGVCQFQNLSSVSIDGINPNAEYEPCDDALWDFGDGTTSTQYNPSHQYTSPGTYNVRLISGLNGFGCTDTAQYTVYFPNLNAQIDTVACDSIRINNILYTNSGDYTQTRVSALGCDSTIHIHLTLHNSNTNSISHVACESYTWEGDVYEESGVYQKHLQTASGCDSLLILNLTIGHSATTDLADTACEFYQWNNETYTESGIYSQHLQTSLGCDSVVNLHLHVGHDVTSSFTATACDNYTWNGVGYSSSGVYTQYFQTSLNCDSVVNLHLTIGHPEITDITDTICSGDDYNKYNFHISHNSSQSLSFLEEEKSYLSQYGCDSTVYLHLTVLDTSLSIVPSYPDFCENMYQELTVETNFADYVWNTGDVSSHIVVTEPGEYSVTASYKQCTATKSYIIEPCEIPVFVPNTITPGTRDGNNDYFFVSSEAMPYVEQFEINIYSRWGVLVFTSNDPGFHWDGKINGHLLLNQIYTYRITMTTVFKEKHFIKGTVLVL